MAGTALQLRTRAIGITALLLAGCSVSVPSFSYLAARQQAAQHKLPDWYQGKAMVERAVDGDTIELTTGDRVRYIGIDTPETVDPRKPVQCFGHEAAEQNRRLVEGKEVNLVADVEDKDKYNRLLRYVYQGNTFVNLELVRLGYAYAYSYPPSVAHESDFRTAQEEARAAKRGLWAGCSTADTSPHLKRSEPK